MALIVGLAVLALVVARVATAPRGTWRHILAAAVLAALGSQLLPVGNAFRTDVAASARSLGWVGLALLPVAAYALGIRWLRQRTGAARGGSGHPSGLVQIADDAALAADTEAALLAEAEVVAGAPATLSLGWRAGDGSLAGHLRMRQTAETAEILALRVAPGHRGQGIGGRLLAEAAAREGGARRVALAPGSWQAPGFFARAGYRKVAEHALGGGLSRLWMERDLA